MVAFYALVSALLYGSADFLGGAAARRAHVLSVLVISAAAGLLVVLAAAVVSGQRAGAAGLGWGLCAGAVGGTGLIVFYSGLAAGPMSVVAPISALVSTVLPVAVALAGGERPGPAVYVGGGLCLAAIVLVSSGGSAAPGGGGSAAPRSSVSAGPGDQAAGERGRGLAIAYGIMSGASFGIFFLFMRYGGESGALWPVAAARLAGLAVILIVAAAARKAPLSWRAGSVPFLTAVAAGVLDSSANVSYVLATRQGLFGLAVVLVALYPGVTVLLARVLLGERLRWAQHAGLAIAAVGVALVTS
ncbi:MAG TPA: EamA family transporter [Streptosporangiaceae bacterium]|nr:EamA family transporter [Streptosporangiaceae bacterium]